MKRLPLIGFLVAHGINTTGTKMTLVALPLLVYLTTGSATLTGLVAFVQMGLYVAVKALGAPLVDRVGRRRVGIAANWCAAALLAAIPALHLAGALPFAVMLGLLGLTGAAQGLGSGAERVLLPRIVASTGTNLERAVTVFDGVDRTGSLLGAPIGGLLVAVIGAANVLWFDAASFAAAALLLTVTIPAERRDRATRPDADRAGASADPPGPNGAAGEREPYFASLLSGLRFLRRQPILLATAGMVALTNMLDQGKVAVMMPVWVTDVVGDPKVAGWVFGAGGLGAVCGSALFIWLAPKVPRRLTFGLCFLISGAPQFLSMAFFDNGLPVIAISFAVGFTGASLNPILSAVFFEKVPDELRARVHGLTGALGYAGIPFGGLLGGLAVSGFGIVPTLWGTGALFFLITLAPFVFPVWRELDRAAPERPARVEIPA